MVTSRKDCFFGLHFDFHAMEGEEIGSIIDAESIENMLDATKPDMIQVDTKGHPGISSYMTRAGVHAEVMKLDTLKLWRELTAKRGIRLYTHHSGLFDQTQARLHPDWQSLNAEGNPYGARPDFKGFMSPFSPYADEVLIPQLREIAGEYHADGAWIDGDEWGMFVDYSPWAKNAYRAEYGKEAPLPNEEGYLDYVEFCREGFRRYVAHYIAEIKKDYPDFEITSNWMYTHTMPEKRTVDIDFISGDYDCTDSVNSARELSRCILAQELTWDLMAWGQTVPRPVTWATRNRCTKEAPQLCQEAAVVLALGGGFQFFNILYGTGGMVQRWAIDSWREIADFCHARRDFCFGGKEASDIAVLYARRYGNDSVFTGAAFDNVAAFIKMLQDAGFSSSVMNEADMEKIDKYKVIFVPRAEKYDDETIEILKEFAYRGGTVIADGGVDMGDAAGAGFGAAEKRLVFPDCGGKLTCLETDYFAPELKGARVLEDAYDGNYYYEKEKRIGAIVNEYGKGKVVSLCFDLSTVYKTNLTYALKQFTKKLLGDAGYVAKISVTGSGYADLTLMEKDGKTYAHVINMAGEHNCSDIRAFAEIPKIGPLFVTVREESEPKSVIALPEGEKLELVSKDGGFTYKLSELKIHTALEINM